VSSALGGDRLLFPPGGEALDKSWSFDGLLVRALNSFDRLHCTEERLFQLLEV